MFWFENWYGMFTLNNTENDFSHTEVGTIRLYYITLVLYKNSNNLL